MLDKDSLSKLSLLISDSINKVGDRNILKRKINGILHNKSVKNVVRELYKYLSAINGQEKNSAVIITIMALLRRDLDCGEEIAKYVSDYSLTGCLYGGLYKLLSGDSKNFFLRVKLNDCSFENKFEYIHRFPDFHYYELIVLFESAKVLSLSDIKKFEQLALADRSNLILLNMVTHRLNVKPSDELIIKLLQEKDELRQNIAFSFITDKITLNINRICDINRSKANGLYTSQNIREVKNDLKNEMKRCSNFLEQCDKETRASLLLNYILVHQNSVPIVFAYDLMSESLQEQFIKQITETKKIKLLKDVYFLVDLIYHTPALNENHRRISKLNLYAAITDILIRFIKDGSGIYGWDATQKSYIENICQKLPPKFIRKLKSFLINKKHTLMCTQFDSLVRFDIYIKDKRTCDIIDGILAVIDQV